MVENATRKSEARDEEIAKLTVLKPGNALTLALDRMSPRSGCPITEGPSLCEDGILWLC